MVDGQALCIPGRTVFLVLSERVHPRNSRMYEVAMALCAPNKLSAARGGVQRLRVNNIQFVI
jgi:hypothetical protein